MFQDIPMIFIAGFLAFFMGGFVFTYYAILYFESKADEEDLKDDRLFHLPDRTPDKELAQEEEDYSEESKIA